MTKFNAPIYTGGKYSSPAYYVVDFHNCYNVPIKQPSKVDTSFVKPQDHPRWALREELIREEFEELRESTSWADVADALGDLVYVLYGAAIEFGIPLDFVIAEIHRSNMSKLGIDGKPIYRESDNKVLKGPAYSEPDLSFIYGEPDGE